MEKIELDLGGGQGQTQELDYQQMKLYIHRIIDGYKKAPVHVVRGTENRAIYPSGYNINVPARGETNSFSYKIGIGRGNTTA